MISSPLLSMAHSLFLVDIPVLQGILEFHYSLTAITKTKDMKSTNSYCQSTQCASLKLLICHGVCHDYYIIKHFL